MSLIARLGRALHAWDDNVLCSGCGFYYDRRYGHSCTPC